MLKITEIQIDHKSLPVVTDRRPNIRFALESDQQGEALKQAVIEGGGWSVTTDDQLNTVYGGEMAPFTRYDITVHATGVSGETATATAFFETGRLDTPWKAKWITDTSYSFAEKVSPVPMVFQKSFSLEKSVARAWINATALGIYELELNGRKVGEDYFAPGFTSYEHQIQYQTYEVTDQLGANNLLRVTVAGGWAAGSFNYNRKSHISCDRQALLLELHLCFADGSKAVVATDSSWQVTEDGPVKMAEWYDGETFDATFGWEDAVWRSADITSPRGMPQLLAQYGEPVRAQQLLEPVAMTTSTSGAHIYDFGQNFAGVLSVQITKAVKGQKIVFRHAEVLQNGELFVKSLRTAKATVTYICHDGEQMYSPRFTYMGFRYLEVCGIKAEDIKVKALVLHSDFAPIGTFHCSDMRLNRLQENIRWGGMSNFVDIPTDCPQRDEREGWTGDAAVFASTACFNFDMSRFYDKWLLDVKAEQGKGGGIPMVVPRQGDSWPVMANACWGDCCILVPWAEYLARGDKALLKRQYPVMQRFLRAAAFWARFPLPGSVDPHIWRLPFHFGDWCAPEGNVQDWVLKGKWVATAYWANSCEIAAQVADVLELPEQAQEYRALRKKIIRAYRKTFTDGKGKLKKEFQTAYVLPLHFRMTEGSETQAMAHNLTELLRKNNYKLATGFPSTPYLLFALSDNDQLDTAYRVLLQEECPGWLYEVKAGGTTIWERWDALRPDGTVNTGSLTGDTEDAEDGGMVSFNHYANGAVGDWLYRRIAGIEPTSGGYKTFRIAPMPGGGITATQASVRTPFGMVRVNLKIEGKQFYLAVEIPVSTVCNVSLPSGKTQVVSSGHYQFQEAWDRENKEM